VSVPVREHHGGRLHEAARRWGIPVSDWLDLSTGISPWSWPVPAMPESVWRRLPEDDDGLIEICRDALAVPAEAGCLPVSGSQAALQCLPRLRAPCRVGVPAPGYAEHGLAWSREGHELVPLVEHDIEAALPSLDVLICINPNNPTGRLTARDNLLRWHGELAARGGWLVVDEAFLDASAGDSLVPFCRLPGLMVLRSLGKFYGLAGVRAGVMVGPRDSCAAMESRLGPWALSHPARFIMAAALQDSDWQQQQRQRLQQARQALDQRLRAAGFEVSGDCDLFAYVQHLDAVKIQEGLARQGVLVRLFREPLAIRFAVPAGESDLHRLAQALAAV